MFTPSIDEDAIFTELRRFLLIVLAEYTGEILQGQLNRVPQPAAEDHVIMWMTRNARLSTNVDLWDGVNDEIGQQRSSQISIQCDVHGPQSFNMAHVMASTWRSMFATDMIDGDIITPLYANDPRQVPFINGENQYENRWIVELQMQANPVVSTPAEFADKLAATVIPPADGV